MLSLSIRTASTAQHSTAHRNHPLHKAANQALPCRSEYVSKDLRTYMDAASGLFSWSMELLAFASRLFALKNVGPSTASICHSN